MSVEVYWIVLYWQKKMVKKSLLCYDKLSHSTYTFLHWNKKQDWWRTVLNPKHNGTNHPKIVKCRFVARFKSRLVIVYYSFCFDLTLQIAKENTFYAKMLRCSEELKDLTRFEFNQQASPLLNERIHYRSDFQARQSIIPQNIHQLLG